MTGDHSAVLERNPGNTSRGRIGYGFFGKNGSGAGYVYFSFPELTIHYCARDEREHARHV